MARRRRTKTNEVPDELRQEVLERLAAADAVVPLPERWLVHERAKHGGRPHGFIALRPLPLGSRQVQAGDILAADEESPALEHLLIRHDVAELPLDAGVLALVLAFRQRIDRLEAELAEARA